MTALPKVASAIGIPLYTNHFTLSKTRILYARIIIEIGMYQPLLNFFMISTHIVKNHVYSKINE